MGKYIRKPKTSGDVAVKDASQSYLGVRTRAKTLALQRLRSSADASPPPKTDYLQLRSRRLQKPPLLRKNFSNSGKAPAPAAAAAAAANGNPQFGNSAEEPFSEPASLPVCPAGGEDGRFERVNGGGSDNNDSEIKASVGENNLEFEARDRGTRESTPCSFIRPVNNVSTPGSSTRPRSPNSMAQNAHMDADMDILDREREDLEMEEFFARAEQPHQRRFMEKYNFDIVNDMPLTGRYKWVEALP